MTNEIKRWVRTCQECLHIQSAIKPDPNKEVTDSYRNSKCRKCKSEALDYGKELSSAAIVQYQIESDTD